MNLVSGEILGGEGKWFPDCIVDYKQIFNVGDKVITAIYENHTPTWSS